MSVFASHLLQLTNRALLVTVSILAMSIQSKADEDSLQRGLTIDRLEIQDSRVDHSVYHYWHADGWIGDEKNKAFLKTEGAHSKGRVTGDVTQLLYGWSISQSWTLEAGAAHTGAPGSDLRWMAIAAEGDLPFSTDSESTLFWRDNQFWLKTQFERAVPIGGAWKFVPKLELNFYSKNDPAHQTGSGFSNAELSLRLAYDFKKSLAGYVGYSRYQTFGNTAEQQSAVGNPTFDNLLITGLMVSL